MIEAKVSEDQKYQVSRKENKFIINGEEKTFSLEQISGHEFHAIHEGRSWQVFVDEILREDKKVILSINNKRIEVELSTELDLLLKKMGLSDAAMKKAGDLKAPMPGLIHTIMVKDGQEVEKGDPLLILEAMKMENVIKADAAGTVTKIHVDAGASVEKGALLISFS